ncbi:MAG: MATE family efflux transporter [Lachnospiraceae bacterium]|nr:MATE family efflux transporter [Lachnospiraceae bacterium]
MVSGKKFDWKDFIRSVAVLAVPIALQNLLTTTGSMVDTIMLASLGSDTVGAVGLCAQFSSLMFSCYWGFVGGGMLFFAQYWGAGNGDGIRRAYGITLTFMSCVAVIFTVAALCFPDAVLHIYTDKAEIRLLGVPYLRLVALSYPLQILAMAMSAMLRCIERVRIPLAGGIASVVTNFTINYILIFGKLGFPRMGARGAAIGTVIASAVNVLVIVAMTRKRGVPYLLDVRRHFRWTRAFVAEYLRKCFPIICNEFLIGVGNMLINVVLGRQTTAVIAAVAVFRTLEGIVIAFFSGFSNASSVLVGKKVGEGDHETAYARAVRLVYMCSGIIAVACLLLFALHSPILHAMSLQGESFRVGTQILAVYGVMAVIRMGNWVQNDTFRSAGDAAFGSVMEITFMYTLLLPCVYVANFVLHAPFLMVFALCYVDEPIRYLIMQRHLYSGKWIKPVTDAGRATIAQFREDHHIRVRAERRGRNGKGSL